MRNKRLLGALSYISRETPWIYAEALLSDHADHRALQIFTRSCTRMLVDHPQAIERFQKSSIIAANASHTVALGEIKPPRNDFAKSRNCRPNGRIPPDCRLEAAQFP
jgi:hypothetical protein